MWLTSTFTDTESSSVDSKSVVFGLSSVRSNVWKNLFCQRVTCKRIDGGRRREGGKERERGRQEDSARAACCCHFPAQWLARSLARRLGRTYRIIHCLRSLFAFLPSFLFALSSFPRECRLVNKIRIVSGVQSQRGRDRGRIHHKSDERDRE